DPWQQLIDGLRAAAGAAPDVLVEFLRSDDDAQIRAAGQVAAALNISDEKGAAALRELLDHPTPLIGPEVALAPSTYTAGPFDDVAAALLEDLDSNVRQSALWACKPRRALLPKLIERMSRDDVPWIRQDIANMLGDADGALAGPALLERLAYDEDTYVQQN